MLTFRNQFGLWFFEVKSRKMSQGVVPYWKARSQIVNRTFEPAVENEWSFASQEDKENVALNLGLAEAYRQSKARTEIRKSEENGTRQNGISTRLTGLSPGNPDGSIGSAEKKFKSDLENKRKESEREFKEARIDLSRLFN